MAPPKTIHSEILIQAPVDVVWRAWTTETGCRRFFAPQCRVELEIGGAYEMLFMPENPAGTRGGEGCTILAIEPQRFFSFTWNAPPNMPEIRRQFTHVSLYFSPEQENTRLLLHHDGWGTDSAWTAAFAYFEKAWSKVVLPRLQYRFEQGPVDWDNPPTFE